MIVVITVKNKKSFVRHFQYLVNIQLVLRLDFFLFDSLLEIHVDCVLKVLALIDQINLLFMPFDHLVLCPYLRRRSFNDIDETSLLVLLLFSVFLLLFFFFIVNFLYSLQ